MYFVNPDKGWAVGLDSTIIHTTDGGQNWIRQITNASNGFRFTNVKFTDEMHGWVTGINGSIFRTTDGSATWQQINSGTSRSLNSIHFIDNSRGWAVGDEGTILKSNDGGLTWHQQFSNVYPHYLTSVWFADSLNGWAVGEGGAIISTMDGGGVVNVEHNISKEIIPDDFKLFQNYPNPFNPGTSIQYAISSRQFVILKVYDILGNEIATLVNEDKPAGSYKVEFKLGDSIKYPASGVYFYQLRVGPYIQTKKMVLIR